jgi:hypothetical protein
MIASAAAQPLPAASAPVQAISTSTKTVVVPGSAGHNAITVQLINDKPDKDWYVDPSFWAAIVPAFAVLVTIWNTNKQLKASREALDKQVAAAKETADKEIAAEHERERLDRITKARQEIYSQILADYQKVQALLGGMADRDHCEEISFSEIALMSASVNKLWVWGEVESAYQVREFYSQVNEMAWSARAKAEAIRTLKQRYDAFKQSFDESTNECDRVAKEVQQHESKAQYLHQEESWSQDNELLIKELRGHEANRKAAGEMMLRVRARIVERREAYGEFLIEGQTRLMTQINKVMALARGDVGLVGNVSRLEHQSHEMSARARTAVINMRREYEEELKLAPIV